MYDSVGKWSKEVKKTVMMIDHKICTKAFVGREERWDTSRLTASDMKSSSINSKSMTSQSREHSLW